MFGESEGKDGKGIFPASAEYTTDLHSFGQLIQEGERNLFQTIVHVEREAKDIRLGRNTQDVDGLNYLAGKTLSYINKQAERATCEAHVAGGVPNLIIRIPEISADTFGYLVYFFMKACVMSGYLQGVNPFDQPGVEAYKTEYVFTPRQRADYMSFIVGRKLSPERV